MIGDLVNYNGSVAKINSGRLSFLAYVEENPESEEAKVIGKYEPIPITKEMLKANVNDNCVFFCGRMEWYINDNCILEYDTSFNHLKAFYLAFGDKVKYLDICVMYVHELQHALRLLELNELADNLKIQ